MQSTKTVKTGYLLLVVALLMQTALAASQNKSAAKENASDNGSSWLPEINTSAVGEKLTNASKTGVEPIDQVTSFLIDASPFLILIIGILLIVLSGFGKIIGVVLIILALIRLIQMLFFS